MCDSLALNCNTDFDFKAEHNGESCIESLKPEDKGTERQFWFTSKMLCSIFDVTRQTLEDNIQSLVEDGEIACAEISACAISGGNNRLYNTAIYNLEVLNKLGMCCFRGNKKAKEIRNKFNDVLVKHETQRVLPQDYISALRALADAEEEKQRLALEAKFAEEQKALAEQQRDEAIRTKAYISDKKTATALGRVGGLVKENNCLKDNLYGNRNYRTIRAIASMNHLSDRDLNWRRLKAYCITNGLEIKKVPDEKFGMISSYPVEAFRAVYPELTIR